MTSPPLPKSASPNATAAIGVFDSGLGGLTVVRQLCAQLPQESIIYVADQAHVPYGGRELAQVCGFACAISESLFASGCKAIVMACNISSATALPGVQAEYPDIPILGVIQPGAQAALQITRAGRIGVLATEGTVRSGAYTRTLHALEATVQVVEVPCPAFVPLVEAGEVASPAAFAAARDYLAPLQDADVDTIILGCTHYPFLLSTLRATAPGLAFVDPAEQTAHQLANLLSHRRLRNRSDADVEALYLLATTGDTIAFAAQTCRFLPATAQTAEVVSARWEEGRLLIGPS